jgi:hypothetical protein
MDLSILARQHPSDIDTGYTTVQGNQLHFINVMIAHRAMECPLREVIICVRDRHGGIFASNIRPFGERCARDQLDLKGALIAVFATIRGCISEIPLTASLFLSLIYSSNLVPFL